MDKLSHRNQMGTHVGIGKFTQDLNVKHGSY